MECVRASSWLKARLKAGRGRRARDLVFLENGHIVLSNVGGF